MSHTTKARFVLDVEYRGVEKNFYKIFEPIKYRYIGQLVNNIKITVEESQTTKHPAEPDYKLRELNQHKRIAKKILELAGYKTLHGKTWKSKHEELCRSVSRYAYRALHTAGAFDQAPLTRENKLAKITGSKNNHKISTSSGPEMFLDLDVAFTYSDVTYMDYPYPHKSSKIITSDITFSINKVYGLTIRDTHISLWDSKLSISSSPDPHFWEIKSVDLHNPNSFQDLADKINSEMSNAAKSRFRSL